MMLPLLTPDLWVLAAAVLVNLFIGAWVFLTGPRDPARWAFFMLVLGGALWIFGFVMLSTTLDFRYDIVTNYGGLFLIAGTFWFATRFPTPTPVPVRPWLLYAPLAIAAVAIIPQHFIVSGITPLPDGGFTPIPGPLLPLWSGMTLAYTAGAIALFITRYRNAAYRERTRLRYLFVGLGTFVACAVLFDAVIPAVTGYTGLKSVGPLSSVLFIGLTAYAIVRHQVMGIKVVIQRGVIYSVLLSCIVAFFIGSLQVLRHAFGAYDDLAALMSGLITTLLGIFSAPHIERWFRKLTDPFFFKDTYDYAAALHTLSSVLHANVGFGDLVRESEEALRSILKTESVAIVLDPEADAQAALSIPLAIDGAAIGCIHLGRKRSGDPYTPEDIQLLETFAYQAATALSRAQLLADAKDEAAALERKVSERARELSRARQREQQMLNDLSHNLQTPLTILQTKLDTLKPLLEDDQEVRSFEQSLSELSGFVYDLLSIARLEGGRNPEQGPVDLSGLLKDLAEEIDIIADASKTGVRAEIAPNLFVQGDQKRLREAFRNIASNALKYMRPHKKKEVMFSLYAEGAEVVARIADTGMGISRTDLPHIFDRFYRGKDVPRERTGTGLGLAITKRIIEQHEGTITAQSREDEGTTIEVRLPRTGA